MRAGTATVTITGTGAYTGTATATFEIAKAAQAVTTSNKSVAIGKTVSLGAKTSGDGKLTYKSSDTTVAKVSASGVVTPVKVDTAKVTITAAATGNYKKATKTVTVTVTKGASTIKLAAQTKTYTGKALAYSGKVTKTGSGGKVTYRYYSDAKCTKEVKAASVKAARTYYVRGTVAASANYKAATSAAAKFIISKAANPLAAKVATKTVKYADVRKAAQTVAPITVTGAQGTKAFAVSKWTTAKAKKYFTVNKTSGKVTAKKGTPKGTYKFQVKITAKGSANYKAGSKVVTVTVVVK